MKLEDICSKRRQNEEAQDELLLSLKKIEYQQEDTRQLFIQEKRNKEEVLEYFYGEPEQYLFEDSLEESRRNERHFSESLDGIMDHFSKRQTMLEEESDELYTSELEELKEDAHG